jgi:hypothetical protein
MIFRERYHDSGDFVGQTERYEVSPHPVSGLFELGDPDVGIESHHKKNAIFTETLEAALYLIRTYGFSIRMRGDLTKQRNLISANELQGV